MVHAFLPGWLLEMIVSPIFFFTGYQRSGRMQPDTIVLKGMPSRWFAETRVSSKPSMLVTHTIFSALGKIRCVLFLVSYYLFDSLPKKNCYLFDYLFDILKCWLSLLLEVITCHLQWAIWSKGLSLHGWRPCILEKRVLHFSFRFKPHVPCRSFTLFTFKNIVGYEVDCCLFGH